MLHVYRLAFYATLVSSSVLLGQQYTLNTIAGGAPPSTPAPAISSSIGQPQRATVDSAGNLYFTSSNSVFKIDTNGVMTLIAGNGRPGYSGDGGPAINAQLNKPQGVALDTAGNLYVSDTMNNTIRMVTPDGTISSAVGYGSQGYSGDGGVATNAQLRRPGGLAFDSSGNLYIADSGNNAIRQVTPSGSIPNGTIITFAGTSEQGPPGDSGYFGDGGPANVATLTNPEDVAVDSSGNVYIVDTGNGVIREVTAGNINTVVGNGATGHSGDNGQAPNATLNIPEGLAIDSSTNLYISEYGDNQIRKVSKGIITTIAGTNVFGFGGDGGPAAKAEFANPWGICVDSGGNLYVADLWNFRIRKISSSGNVSTVAGNGLLSYSGDGGAASKAELDGPQGVARDAAGNVYIADKQNNVVREISANGVINTIAGTGTAGFSGDGGAATAAQLNKPQAVAVDATGNVYISDTQNSRVRVVGGDGSINTFAGNGNGGYSGDGGPASNAQINQPYGLAVDGSGSLYIADFNNSRVRKVTSDGTITTVAGNGGTFFAGDGGPAKNASVNRPQSVAVDSAGNLYIADTQNNRVRMVSSDGTINTIAGVGTAGFSGDGGPAVKAQMAVPNSVAMDADGNLYIGDTSTRIRKVSPDGTINTIIGSGAVGYAGDMGPALNAQISGPFGLATDPAGDIYVADSGNNAIRLAQPQGSAVTISSVTNSASNQTGPIAPGEVVVIYGSGLGPAQLTQYQPDSNGLIPTSLAGVRVLFNGIAAPILYASANQLSAAVPYGIAGSGSAQVAVQYQAQTSAPGTLSVADTAPGLITADASGQGQASAFNPDGSQNSASTPASIGSVISLFGTGGGQTSPAATDGAIDTGAAPQVLPVSVTIGGQTATVQYAGCAAGDVDGIMRIDVQIPSGVTPGPSVPVVIQEGGVSSQSGVTIAISSN